MLVVAAAGREDAVREILEKWELEAETIGSVTASGAFRVLEDGVVVADIPALPLTEGCPTYERPGEEGDQVRALRTMDISPYVEPPAGLRDAFLRVVGSPNVASKQWVYEQYDTTVRANSIERPGGDAGVIRIPGTNRGVAASTDCNGRHTYLNPRVGAMGAVAEAARNVACTGAVPLAITNCLNFGSPLKPHIMYQFREAVLGMRDACGYLETPVTGGNVSFYNETDGKAVYPTPVIGMIGVMEDLDTIVRHPFQDAGDAILLLGANTGALGGSEYLYALHDLVAGEPPGVDLTAERALQRCILAMAARRVLKSAHDVASGGLAATLTESCLGRPRKGPGVGASVRFEDDLPDTALLFGEDHGRIVVSCAPDDEARVRGVAADYGVSCTRVGTVTGAGSPLRIETATAALQLELSTLRERYFGAIPGIMDEAG